MTRSMTVAIPTMNGQRHIAEAMESILAQGSVVAEILVCDDRSDDDTPRIIQEIAGVRVRLSVNSERLGLAGNWNQCVRLCRTSLIAIVHQDDRLHSGHLNAHVRAFAAEEGIGLVASASGVVDDAGHVVPESMVGRGGFGGGDRVLGSAEAVAAMAAVNPLRCSAVSMRVEAHVAAGGFRPTLYYVVDWAFWLEVARDWSVAWLASPTVDIRWHAASETHRFKAGTLDLEESERVLSESLHWLKSHSYPTTEIERNANRRLARAYLNRAHDALRAGAGGLGKRCLRRSFALWPGILRVIAADPRLGAMMTALSVAPESAGRWFQR